MKSRTKVVVIGGGIAGCSTLYHLTQEGWTDVVLVERNEPTLVLMRSFLVQLLDIAEAVIPALTPEAMSDNTPAMRPHSNIWSP